MARYAVSNLLGLLGAVIGGAAGFYLYRWLLNQGYVGLMIPGAFLGLGCSLLARHPSLIRGLFCGFAGLFLTLFTFWQNMPPPLDPFMEFLKKVNDISTPMKVMGVLGTLIAFWLGKDAGLVGRSRRDEPGRSPAAAREPQPQPEQGEKV
jgi:hypothetical protein